ncbi:MAG TPA: transcription elongation factor GreA [Thermoflexales bacterium]|nr:transcription elongation factor GreA [Thermoflexales bacterium]HQW36872.1 transcription elongation factor GreA [Thermoflexales bacterium]HQX75134.1 transcription elongation factor GreA [Thermoflexales bacterium]HQZ21325.1 transcription elongation factor GreA [Thermoflexales bacterium]HQZ99535.1 transcription elongation factor GreA [Thermoflexales bacterium]
MHEQEYLTPQGLKKLEEELEFLTTTRRAEVAERLHQATEEGEIEENPEYEDAKNEQAFVEGRILTIQNILANAVLIEKQKGATHEVRVGNYITITELGTANKEHYTIVGSAESNPAKGLISNESPLGKALIGKKLHEEVSVSTPDGPIKYKVTHISSK